MPPTGRASCACWQSTAATRQRSAPSRSTHQKQVGHAGPGRWSTGQGSLLHKGPLLVQAAPLSMQIVMKLSVMVGHHHRVSRAVQAECLSGKGSFWYALLDKRTRGTPDGYACVELPKRPDVHVYVHATVISHHRDRHSADATRATCLPAGRVSYSHKMQEHRPSLNMDVLNRPPRASPCWLRLWSPRLP